MSELLDLPVRQLAMLVFEGKVSAESVVSGFLSRIAMREGTLGAWVSIEADAALAEAREPVVGRGPLSLLGIPIGVKDVIDTADMPTAYGSALYAGFQPATDAACVALAREAGAVILGKTVTSEFALSSPGRTRNPVNEAHSPGASSCGSAAAVAAGMIPLAIGSQTGGSIVRPASFCGVVGYKPSFGLIDRTGLKPLAQSMDTVGVFARSVADAAVLAGILARRDLLPSLQTAPMRIGLYGGSTWSGMTVAARTALQMAAEAFERAGAELVELPEFPEQAQLRAAHRLVARWEIASSLAFERVRYLRQLRGMTRLFMKEGPPSSEEYAGALAIAAAVRSQLEDKFRGCDALLAPAAVDEAPKGRVNSGDPVHCLMWSLLHTPCFAIPVARGPNGLPVGVQLIGHIGNDPQLIRAAMTLEQALIESGTGR